VIYLIWVEHLVQWRQPRAYASPTRQVNWLHYSSIIEKAIDSIHPSVLSEELNQEFLVQHNHAESLLLCIKRQYEARTEMKFEHVFAEPCAAQKAAIGYKEPKLIERILKRRCT
jgi:hypothetical protein